MSRIEEAMALATPDELAELRRIEYEIQQSTVGIRNAFDPRLDDAWAEFERRADEWTDLVMARAQGASHD